MRKKKWAVIVMVLVFVLALAPTATFATPAFNMDAQLEELSIVFEAFAAEENVRMVALTPEARDIALADFDYLVDVIMQVAPSINVLQRRTGFCAEDFFSIWRQVIYDNIPVPSKTAMMIDDRWVYESDDARYRAADYLFSLLGQLMFQLDGLGHFSPQPSFMAEFEFFASAITVHTGAPYLDEETVYLLQEMGFSQEDIDDTNEFLSSVFRFHQLRYEIFNTPSVLWFYDIDPAAFYFGPTAVEDIGMMDPYNITTVIIEPGRIAYIQIASFMNNIEMDNAVLFPFYAQIQDYEHLIIDLRGNGGGQAHHFPVNVANMLIGEPVQLFSPEFFRASQLTAGFYENPSNMVFGVLDGRYPVAEFVQSQNLTQFNQDDLELLDYVLVWRTEYDPTEESISFDGKIWLLVDGESASASENAAKFSIGTGFATVVGEPTAGVTGVLYTFAALPATGILFRIDLGYTTDQYGRSFEEFGVIPQIPNAPDMDALETVLAIIADGALQEAPPAQQLQMQIPLPPALVVAEPVLSQFVSIRQEAYANGYTVEWDSENNAVLVVAPDGTVRVVQVSVSGTFNDNGTVFVTVEYASEIFGQNAE